MSQVGRASLASVPRVIHDLRDLPAPAFSMPVRVYYEDTDAGGIVYHASYLRFFERARTDWLRGLGAVHSAVAARDNAVFVVKSMALDYLRPARLDDELDVDVRILHVRRASLQLAQVAALHNSGTVLVTALVRVAMLDRETDRPTALPDGLLACINTARQER